MHLPDTLQIHESPVDGLGIFAKQSIAKDTALGDYTGVKMTRSEFLLKYGADYRYCYTSAFPWNPIICAKEDRNFITYINESTEPNVFLKKYKLYALRDITEGEELFLKYPKMYNRTYHS